MNSDVDFFKERCRGFFVQETEQLIVLNFWGGEQTYNKVTKTYKMVRSSGIFSNLNVAIYCIFVLTSCGYQVDEVEFVMKDYYHDRNIYPLVFEKNMEFDLNFNDIDRTKLLYFLEKNYPNILGLNFSKNTSKNNFCFEITSLIVKKFFSVNSVVNDEFNYMLAEKKLRKNDYVFIWARRTDKVYETTVPNAKKYIEIIKILGLESKQIVLQTDDKSMFDEFKLEHINFDYFESMPFAKGDCFHQKISHTDDNIFYNDYNMTKDEYFIKMFCVLLLAVNANKAIIYPGNATTSVPIYKNSFNDCILFYNESEYEMC